MTTQELVERLEAMAKYEEAGEYHLAAKRLRAAASRLSALEAENKRLREALKPFADEWEYWKDDADIAEQGYLIFSDGVDQFPANIPVAAFHAARAALEPKP